MNATSPKSSKDLSPELECKWGSANYWYWDGFKCHWRALGPLQKQAIILIHGFGASSDHWRNNAASFAAAGFRVFALDLIGFGDSDQPSFKKYPPLDNYFWANQIVAFIEEVVLREKNNKQTILIGNSLGALAALTTIELRPELIAAVIGAPLPDPAFMQAKQLPELRWCIGIKRKLLTFFWHLIPLKALILIITRTPLINKALQAAYCRSIKLDKELKRMVIQPTRKPNAANALRAMCIGMSIRPFSITAPHLLERIANKSVRTPILLIWGRKDQFVPLMIGQRIKKRHAWLDLSIMEQTGHCPHDEAPNEFNTTVLNWLDINLGTNNQEA